MRAFSKIITAVLLLFVATTIAVAKSDTATITKDGNGHDIVRVHLVKTTPVANATGELLVVNKVDDSLELVTNSIIDMSANYDSFSFRFPDAPSNLAFNPDKSYVVELLVPKQQDGAVKILKIEIQAAPVLNLSLSRSSLGISERCGEGITLEVATELNNYDWQSLFRRLDQLEPHPKEFATVKIHVQGDDADSWFLYPLKSVTDDRQSSTSFEKLLKVCLLGEKRLPTGTLDVEVSFGNNRPADFSAKVTKKKLSGSTLVASPKDEEPGSPDKRLIEQNLDVGVSLTSSVADEDVPATATTAATTKRTRTTRGILDVRYAPVLDVLHPTIDDNKWMHLLMPFFVNANVATGKITKDTLSLNRVLLGLQGQFRRRVVHGDDKISTQRIIYGFTHASDRDFKQDEFTGKLEWAPIFWKLNRPISLNYTVNKRSEEVHGKFGYTFLPKVGFEIGRTYHRRNPADALQLSPNVRRFYFGVDMSLDLTRFLTLTVGDIAYVRGETPDHRLRNYFKGGVEAPMGRLFGSAVHSLFFSFEKGDQPPFATPAVNAMKLGYRVQY